MSHLDDLLSALLDGELTHDERIHVHVSAHLGTCETCRHELSDLAVARTAVRGLPMLEPPFSVFPDAEVLPLRRFRRPMALASAGAAALALVVGLAVSGDGTAPAVDLDTFAEQHTARVVADPGFATIRLTVEDR